MQIGIYDTRINQDYQTILVKENVVEYGINRIDAPEIVIKMVNCLFDLENAGEEYCYMIALNSKCRPLGLFMLSKGSVNSSILSAREIFIRALMIGSVSVVLVHNHPSGDAAPSWQDIKITKDLVAAGKLIGVEVADHVIVGRDNCYSFREHDNL